MRLSLFTCAVCVLVAHSSARADVSMATAADLPGSPVVTFLDPTLPFTTGPNPYTPNGLAVTFSIDPGPTNLSGTNGFGQLNIAGNAQNLYVSFASAVNTLHWTEPNFRPFNEVQLFSDNGFATSLGTFDISGFAVAGSRGFTSDVDFSSARLTTTGTSALIGAFRFGSVSAVPEPSSLALLGVLGSAVVTWRKRRQV